MRVYSLRCCDAQFSTTLQPPSSTAWQNSIWTFEEVLQCGIEGSSAEQASSHRPDIYDIPALVTTAFAGATTIENITSGFKVTGIYPNDSNIFSDDDFLPAEVTNKLIQKLQRFLPLVVTETNGASVTFVAELSTAGWTGISSSDRLKWRRHRTWWSSSHWVVGYSTSRCSSIRFGSVRLGMLIRHGSTALKSQPVDQRHHQVWHQLPAAELTPVSIFLLMSWDHTLQHHRGS